MNRRTLAGAVAVALALPGLWVDRPMFFAAWLAAWWLALGLVLGALGNAWMHRLTGGRWGAALRPATALLAARLPRVLGLGLPLVAGLDALYPWWRGGGFREAMAEPAFNALWLEPRFFALRVALYALAWAWLARPAALAALTPARAAASLLVHAALSSLAAIDLLMSLMPGWTSTVFALLVLTGQLLGGAALAVGLTARCRAPRVPPAEPPVWRDLGNLLLTWVLGWAYLGFVQLLIIWAENLPREIAWYVPRLQSGWIGVGIALVVLHFALPLLALLMRALKDDPRRLATIAFGLLGAHALQVAWLVLPSVEPASAAGWWLVPALVAGIGLLAFGDLPARLRTAGDAGTTEWGDVRAAA